MLFKLLTFFSGLLAFALMPDWSVMAAHERVATSLTDLTAINAGISHDIAVMRRDIRSMRQSTAFREHVVRDELGWLRPGEIWVNLHKPP